MDQLQAYESSDSSSSANEVQLPISPGLLNRTLRSVYLVTYSQTDLSIFPSRASFAEELVKYFGDPKVKVTQWVCSLEHHANNSGVHYHAAVKLSMNRK